MNETALTYEQCRVLARRLCDGPSGREVRNSLRPRGMTGVWRGRAPVSVQLYVASRRGLLVATDGDDRPDSPGESLMLLQPPQRLQHVLPASTTPARWLHRLDRYWDLVLFAAPPVVALLAAAAVGFAGDSTSTRWTAVSLAFAAMLWTVLGLLLLVARSTMEMFWLTERARGAQDVAGPYLIHTNWTARALMIRGPEDSPLNSTEVSTLVAEALARARSLLTAHRVALDVEPPKRLVVVLDGVTRADLREVVVRHHDVVLVIEDRRPSVAVIGSKVPAQPAKVEPVSPAGMMMFLVTVVVVVVFAAWVIGDQERAACLSGRTCVGRGLLTTGDALSWLLARMVLQEPPSGLSPVLRATEYVGMVMPLLGLITLATLTVTVRRTTVWIRRAEEITVSHVTDAEEGLLPRVGILTILPLEFVAMRQLLVDRQEERLEGYTRYVLAQLPSRGERPHRVVLTKQYLAGTANAATAVTRLLQLYPTVQDVIVVGIACGIPRPENPRAHVRLGDIVVSSNLGVIAYEDVDELTEGPRRRPPAGGLSRHLMTADEGLQISALNNVYPWEALMASASLGLKGFGRPDPATDVIRDDNGTKIAEHSDPVASNHVPGRPKVQAGRIASGNRWYRSALARDELDRSIGGALALDMESAGLANAAVDNGVGWFVVRGISDYGDATTPRAWHRYAAIAAAAYTRALLAQIPPTAPKE